MASAFLQFFCMQKSWFPAKRFLSRWTFHLYLMVVPGGLNTIPFFNHQNIFFRGLTTCFNQQQPDFILQECMHLKHNWEKYITVFGKIIKEKYNALINLPNIKWPKNRHYSELSKKKQQASCLLVPNPVFWSMSPYFQQCGLVPSFTSLRPTANYNEECLVGPFCQPVTHVLSMKKSLKY